ncbi:MAG: EAL domain-containing response regulator [Xanthomonadales bacterium]|nr:EAL domain-containing response regulator [Xanthomonadales bacterium]
MALPDLRIMVVEDHGFQRRMALRILGELGVTKTMESADGQSALNALAAADERPDIVLVDLDLPGMDGIELIGLIAERRLARSVVLVSALDSALMNTVQTMARAYGLRVIGAIEKPLAQNKLRDMLDLYESGERETAEVVHAEVSPQQLAEALERDEIVPYFQPQVTFTNGQVVAVEALARWVRADGSMVWPSQFIPVAEREGLIDGLTERLLDKACGWKLRWAQRGLHLRLAVNMSMANLHRIDAADRFQTIVRSHGVDPREVVLELTESSVMEEAAAALHVLARLRLKGFGLSIDDFGTGYSSLSQLAQIPFTELKIDRSFVGGAPGNARKRAVVETSLDLARKLNLAVVAEGLETVEEWQMLAELGCTFGQGYLIARPVAGDLVPEAVARWRLP